MHGLRAGFTLVELAIVLVIIALLVGGVLVGQDLIKAAEISATASQVEKYDTAASTFRTKYRGLPGDLHHPAAYPISDDGADGSLGKANNDGVLQPGDCTDPYGYGGETALFWTHLNEANLIPDATSGVTDYAAVAALTITDEHLPPARLGSNNRFHAVGISGRNYYVLANFTGTAATTCTLSAADTLTPQQALQLDTKLDDGNAMTGRVISLLDGAIPTAASGGNSNPDGTGTDDCYDSDNGVYATSTDALATAMECQLRIRTSF